MPLLSGDMTIRFIARAVGVQDGADDCLSAGIAETEDGDGLMFDGREDARPKVVHL
jgi:hypothetical protein